MSGTKKPWHNSQHDAAARILNAQADADPTTRCWRCGRTMAEIRRTKPRARWQAGHLIDGVSAAGYGHECSECNARAGQALAVAARQPRTDLTW